MGFKEIGCKQSDSYCGKVSDSFSKVLDSNFERDTVTLADDFHDLARFREAKAGIILPLGHDRFLPNPYQSINEPTIRCRAV
jgi:hypothetical protein